MSGSQAKGADKARQLLEGLGLEKDGLVIVGGSTWPGEEEILVDVFKELKAVKSGLKLVLVPRHAERREEVSAVIAAAGLSFVRKTDLDAGARLKPADVLLVDTTGELMSFYAVADVVFVGKSLTQHGGQNFIEPAMSAKPIIVGSNLENFTAVARDFLEARALVKVSDRDGLARELKVLLENEAHRMALGERAGGLVQIKRGAVKRMADRVLSLL